jgi:polyhydroxybutyrate depolymerase
MGNAVSILTMVRSFLVAALLLTVAGPACAKSKGPLTNFNLFVTPGAHSGSVPVGDYDRQFVIVTPKDADFDHPAAVVFFFHGAGGSAEQAMQSYGWVEKAKKEHFFVVFPQGLGLRPGAASTFLNNPAVWRDERPGTSDAVSDVDFFSTLLTKLEEVLPIDHQRVFVTGFSNGAGMTFALGAHFSDRIAAIAPVASQSFVTADTLARPLPVYYLVGGADPLIPFTGGEATTPWGLTRTWPPVQQSVDQWVKLDGCDQKPENGSVHDGVRVQRYRPRHDGAEVIFTVVTGNGHHWPVSVEALPRQISGPALDPFSATDRIWDFFRRHPLRS